jgi:hypothetical protein
MEKYFFKKLKHIALHFALGSKSFFLLLEKNTESNFENAWNIS